MLIFNFKLNTSGSAIMHYALYKIAQKNNETYRKMGWSQTTHNQHN